MTPDSQKEVEKIALSRAVSVPSERGKMVHVEDVIDLLQTERQRLEVTEELLTGAISGCDQQRARAESAEAEAKRLRTALEKLNPDMYELLERTDHGNYYRICIDKSIDSLHNFFNAALKTVTQERDVEIKRAREAEAEVRAYQSGTTIFLLQKRIAELEALQVNMKFGAALNAKSPEGVRTMTPEKELKKLILLCRRIVKRGPNYRPEMNGWVGQYEKRRQLLTKRLDQVAALQALPPERGEKREDAND